MTETVQQEPTTRSVAGQCPRCKNMSLWEIDGIVCCVDGCGPLPEIVVEGSLPGCDELDADELDDTPQHTDRQLLVAVSRWAHANGWYPDHLGWINARTGLEATIAVCAAETRDAVRVWRKQPDSLWPLNSVDYPVDSVRQAVDILVDLGILPDTLHRLYPQTATVAELTDELKRLRAKLDGPCGSCHPCTNWADETWRRADRKPPAVITWDDTQDELRKLRAENDELRMQVRLERQRADRYQRRADETAATTPAGPAYDQHATSPAQIAAGLRRAAADLEAMGDVELPPTWVQLSLQPVRHGGSEDARIAAVDALSTALLGAPAQTGDGQHASSYDVLASRGDVSVSVYTGLSDETAGGAK